MDLEGHGHMWSIEEDFGAQDGTSAQLIRMFPEDWNGSIQ